MKIEEAKRLQNAFKLNLNQISRERYKSTGQKRALENIKLFMNHEKLLLNYLMIFLQLHLRQNTKQFMEKEFQVCQHA